MFNCQCNNDFAGLGHGDARAEYRCDHNGEHDSKTFFHHFFSFLNWVIPRRFQRGEHHNGFDGPSTHITADLTQYFRPRTG